MPYCEAMLFTAASVAVTGKFVNRTMRPVFAVGDVVAVAVAVAVLVVGGGAAAIVSVVVAAAESRNAAAAESRNAAAAAAAAGVSVALLSPSFAVVSSFAGGPKKRGVGDPCACSPFTVTFSV